MSKSKPTAKVKPPKPALVVESSLVPAPRLSRGRTRESAILPVAPALASLPADYASLLTDIKKHIVQARLRTVLAANVALIRAYWHIGHTILARQKIEGWGARVIDRLSADLRESFPEMSGLSPRNLLAMKVFAREFPQAPIAQQPVAQLPWGHVLRHPDDAPSIGLLNQARSRIRPARPRQIHRRLRAANPPHRNPPQRTPRQPAHHRGNRGGNGWADSFRKKGAEKKAMTASFVIDPPSLRLAAKQLTDINRAEMEGGK